MFKSAFPWSILQNIAALAFASGGLLSAACDVSQSSADDDAAGGTTSVTPHGGTTSTTPHGGTTSTSSGGTISASKGGAPSCTSDPVGPSFGGSSGPGFATTTPPVGMGSINAQYDTESVTRNGVNYTFIANGWGPKFKSQTISWNGTAFTVQSLDGAPGPGYEPAGYPTVFCGVYSVAEPKACGLLPKAISSIKSLWTGWKWKPNCNTGQYNAAYDIWISSDNTLAHQTAFLMVWYRDPPGQQPAGSVKASNISVPGVPGTWDLWVGTVSNKPYIAYVRAQGQDLYELEFDVMNFVKDAQSGTRGVTMPGTTILSVAVGFEIWNPVTNLESQDFYVNLTPN